ncbi:MAG: AbrB/MazE/SpoVT family DNA-binding domain-containing protein, partial [Clostridia bacterium]|nr:AbrB/MazE/SpoVT family DNA-binding domain-containing protein [Clostridia bacterium]
VDELGRIVLPIELRKTFNIVERDALEIYTEGNTIVLKKYEPACIFCGDSAELVDFNDKKVCKKCIEALNNASL